MLDRFYLIFTIVVTSHLLAIGLASCLLTLVYLSTAQYREMGFNLLKIVLKLAGGFLTGAAIAWLFVIIPSGWNLPIWETFYAGFHSEIYGQEVEHAAEAYTIFIIFIGDLGAIAAGIMAWMLKRRRLHSINKIKTKKEDF